MGNFEKTAHLIGSQNKRQRIPYTLTKLTKPIGLFVTSRGRRPQKCIKCPFLKFHSFPNETKHPLATQYVGMSVCVYTRTL